jgi:hypothetical protein
MKKDDALGLFLRCLGAWEVVQGIVLLPTVLAGPEAIMFAAPRLVVGTILFYSAGYFVEMTYGQRREPISEPDF